MPFNEAGARISWPERNNPRNAWGLCGSEKVRLEKFNVQQQYRRGGSPRPDTAKCRITIKKTCSGSSVNVGVRPHEGPGAQASIALRGGHGKLFYCLSQLPTTTEGGRLKSYAATECRLRAQGPGHPAASENPRVPRLSGVPCTADGWSFRGSSVQVRSMSG